MADLLHVTHYEPPEMPERVYVIETWKNTAGRLYARYGPLEEPDRRSTVFFRCDTTPRRVHNACVRWILFEIEEETGELLMP